MVWMVSYWQRAISSSHCSTLTGDEDCSRRHTHEHSNTEVHSKTHTSTCTLIRSWSRQMTNWQCTREELTRDEQPNQRRRTRHWESEERKVRRSRAEGYCRCCFSSLAQQVRAKKREKLWGAQTRESQDRRRQISCPAQWWLTGELNWPTDTRTPVKNWMRQRVIRRTQKQGMLQRSHCSTDNGTRERMDERKTCCCHRWSVLCLTQLNSTGAQTLDDKLHIK